MQRIIDFENLYGESMMIKNVEYKTIHHFNESQLDVYFKVKAKGVYFGSFTNEFNIKFQRGIYIQKMLSNNYISFLIVLEKGFITKQIVENNLILIADLIIDLKLEYSILDKLTHSLEFISVPAM